MTEPIKVRIRWADLDQPVSATNDPGPPPRSPKHPAAQCLCGRFAKWLGDEHYYNGQFDCYRYTVRCSRCGDVSVECV